MKGENTYMKFLGWLLGTLLIDPLIMLFVWNVIIVAMFSCTKTTFGVCFWISVISNVLLGIYRLCNNSDY
jgi:hypothetical protein